MITSELVFHNEAFYLGILLKDIKLYILFF